MSIYKRAFERPHSDNDVTHTVITTVKAKAPSPPESVPVPPELLRLRKAKPADYLLPTTMAWFRRLPKKVRPVALTNRFARIANVLALDWNRPEVCRRYLRELLVDPRRSKRQGFPERVHRELEALRDYYDSQYPAP
jgi:hypothetical protein